MKRKFLSFTLLGLLTVVSFANATDPDLCAQKSAQVSAEGKTVVAGCTQTYFAKALTADFQPLITHALTANVSQIKGAQDGDPFYQHTLEKYYGLRNMKLLATMPQAGSDASGVTLLSKFSTALKNSFPGDSNVLNYVQGPLTSKIQYRPVSSATGSCQIWSAWSLDPEVQAMMARVNDGILCSGVPFTRGELKELITAVYPEPGRLMEQKDFKGYYDPENIGEYNPNSGKVESNHMRTDIAIEDANLALAKLGDLGSGSGFTPDSLVSMAAAAKAQNPPATLIMDLDPGTVDVWNQPIEAIVDVPYLDNSLRAQDINSYLRSDDLGSSTQDGAQLKDQIARTEAQLKYQSLNGKPVNVSQELYRLRSMAGEQGQFDANSTLMEQVAELKRIQQNLISSGRVAVVHNQVVKHRIFIQYAQEGKFAEDGEMPSVTRELDYISVNGRANWSPPTRKLSAACNDGLVGGRVLKGAGYGLVASTKTLEGDCNRLNQSHVDREIAVGAFPPKNISIFYMQQGDARFSQAEDGKRQAYNKLRDMIMGCDQGRPGSFHEAAQFMDDLKNTIAHNVITSADVARLTQKYRQVKNFLDDETLGPDQNFVKQVIGQTAQAAGGDASRVDGLSSLYRSLFP